MYPEYQNLEKLDKSKNKKKIYNKLDKKTKEYIKKSSISPLLKFIYLYLN